MTSPHLLPSNYILHNPLTIECFFSLKVIFLAITQLQINWSKPDCKSSIQNLIPSSKASKYLVLCSFHHRQRVTSIAGHFNRGSLLQALSCYFASLYIQIIGQSACALPMMVMGKILQHVEISQINNISNYDTIEPLIVQCLSKMKVGEMRGIIKPNALVQTSWVFRLWRPRSIYSALRILVFSWQIGVRLSISTQQSRKTCTQTIRNVEFLATLKKSFIHDFIEFQFKTPGIFVRLPITIEICYLHQE